MYAVILVCIWLHFEWWVRYDWACIIVSLGYVFYLLSIGQGTHGVSIFRGEHQRLQDYADYNEAPYFANSWHNYFAPVRNGDYVVLSNNEYLEFNCYSVFYAKDIDMNRIYICGASMGACGTWKILKDNPKLFAAALIASGQAQHEKPSDYTDTPLYVTVAS